MPDAAPEAAENGGSAEAEVGPGAAEAAAAAEASTAPGPADGPAPMETEAEGPKVEEPKEEVVKKRRTKKLQVPFKVHVEGLSDKIVQVSSYYLSRLLSITLLLFGSNYTYNVGPKIPHVGPVWCTKSEQHMRE